VRRPGHWYSKAIETITGKDRPPSSTLRVIALLVGPMVLAVADRRVLAGEPQHPSIRKLEPVDLDMVETTPVVFDERLCR
jgi:hypothetical protein